MNERLYNLDYLRGLAASGIMLFHYMSITFGEFNADSFMGRVGLYGVSVFYVLSGLTLFYVYHDKMKPGLADIKDFFIKRLFRIMPLLWLATIASVFCFNGGIFEWKKVFLNLSGLFGFVAWDQGIAVGCRCEFRCLVGTHRRLCFWNDRGSFICKKALLAAGAPRSYNPAGMI